MQKAHDSGAPEFEETLKTMMNFEEEKFLFIKTFVEERYSEWSQID